MKARIRELIHTVPFQPFVIHMADGRKCHIKHPDFILASPRDQSWVIVVEEDEDRVHYLSALLMTGIEHAPEVSVAS